MKKPTTLFSMLLAVVLTLALTACGGEKPAAPGGDSGDPIETPVTEPADQTDPDDNAAATDPDVQTNPDGTDNETKQGSGSYTGQIDNHSVEIIVNGEPTSFQLSEGMDAVLEQLNKDDAVTFEYYEKAIEGDDTVKQRILTKLEKS
ncbi:MULTISPECIES: hypothetical protein [unclassified Paenibacillus]|uniref:hypothetical protein n=1 Tax=unclassified Paenibacillus TaxID=185978 RepID=UPI001C110FC2|nr:MULTISPECIES: hypothetical protein [unclassified Paenibacillus]MBU5444944.1 hypothetical protein [Paenibacillus sp. MSJ-34]CAH0120191.1 hypothetical protein PAE9249_02705 [Paenibacillus sp. CECT 9249]